jgi:transcriptional regulator with XRE-family HTH domain
MAKKYSELQARMSPEAQELAKQRANEMLADMPLQELRQARRLSQDTLADTLGITQPQVSKIEHRTDLYLSTLRRYVEAMDGELEIVARFPEGSVRITQFQGLEPDEVSIALVTSGDTGVAANARWEPMDSADWVGPARPDVKANGWKPKVLKGGRGVAA